MTKVTVAKSALKKEQPLKLFGQGKPSGEITLTVF
jgi:hypothetical protein